MDLLLTLFVTLGPLILATYISTWKIPRKTKAAVWIICAVLCLGNFCKISKENKEKNKETKTKEYYFQSIERQELKSKGLPITYVNGLGENPLLKHSFKEGQSYEKESKYKEAIEVYKRCKYHPKATEKNRVAANLLIGNCYYSLSKLKEAEKYYKEVLSISKRVKDEDEMLQGRSSSLGNIGLIYWNLGKPNTALKYITEALVIHKRIGYEHGIANNLTNIGLIYSDLGKPDTALKYHTEALEIDKRTGYEQGIANNLGSIGLIYRNFGKPDTALKYVTEALEIFESIDAHPEMEKVLKNIDVIEKE
jgi:tetratricopeptide (TPR) repeat protein